MYFFFFLKQKYERMFVFFFQAEDGIRDGTVTGVQTCALPISTAPGASVRIELSTAWVRASPSDVGMSAAGLEGATHDAAAVPRFRSLLVARHGRLVAESYFGGADSTT